MFSRRFASTNQLPGFSKNAMLPAPNMRNTERWLLSLTRIVVESELIHFDTPWEDLEIIIKTFLSQ